MGVAVLCTALAGNLPLVDSSTLGNSGSWPAQVALLALALLSGRALLALLPAGTPGAAGRSAIVGAGAAAWLLARTLLELGAALERVLPESGAGHGSLALLCLPLLLLALRLLLGPAAMRPGRALQANPAEASDERGPRRARRLGMALDFAGLALACLVIGDAAHTQGQSPWPAVLDTLALAGLAVLAARVLGLPRHHWSAAAWVPAGAAVVAVVFQGPGLLAVAVGPLAALALAALFRLRPERRFLWLAALALPPSSAALGLWMVPLGIALVLLVPAPSRRRLLAPLAFATALALLLALQAGR
jgi:hypothetical protein